MAGLAKDVPNPVAEHHHRAVLTARAAVAGESVARQVRVISSDPLLTFVSVANTVIVYVVPQQASEAAGGSTSNHSRTQPLSGWRK